MDGAQFHPPSVGETGGRLKSLRGPIQKIRMMAGKATTLVSRKNRTQPIFSDRIPPEEATTVRPTKASEESSAN
jgi:hypothetical protein